MEKSLTPQSNIFPPQGGTGRGLYKAIFLDWDDTIGDFIGAAHQAIDDIYHKYDLQRFYPSVQAFYEVYHPYNIQLWARYGKGEITRDWLAHERFLHPLRVAVSEHGQSFPLMGEQEGGLRDLEALATLLEHDFEELTTQHFSLLPNAEEVVRYLAAKYPITIVSNGFVSVQYRKINASGLKDCFQHIVLSEEVGITKPQPGIFEIALKLNGLQKEDVVMIGDSYTSDIQGAINAGIDQIWLQSPHLTEEERQKPATYKIQNILELKSLL